MNTKTIPDKNFSLEKRTLNNVSFYFLSTLAGVIFPFILKTYLIEVLGEEYLGMTNLFHSIINALCLAEAGFKSSICFELYSPLANNDDRKVCSLLNLYKRIYTIIGLSIGIVGLMMLPFLKYLIKGNIPNGTSIKIVYLIFLLESVINFSFLSNSVIVLIATQKGDINSKINIFIQAVFFVIRLLLLLKYKNYYVFVFFLPISAIFNKTINAIFAKKIYPQFKSSGKTSAEEKDRVIKNTISLTTTKFSDTLIQSINTVFISAYFGLSSLALYSNYYYIVSALLLFTQGAMESIKAILGNSIVLDNKENNFEKFKKTCYVNSLVSCVCTSCLFCLYQDFMKIWLKGKLLGNMELVFFMTLYYFLYQTKQTVITFKDASGTWKNEKLKSLIAVVVNIILDIFFMNKGLIVGVLISNILSIVFIEIPFDAKTLIRDYFNKNESGYYLSIVINIIVCCSCLLISKILCDKIVRVSVMCLLIKGFICVLVSSIIFLLITKNTNEQKYYIKLIKTNINKNKD